MKIAFSIITTLLATVALGQPAHKRATPPASTATSATKLTAPYSFKGNYLGMTLEEFRKLNKRTDTSDILCTDNSSELHTWLDKRNKNLDALAKQFGQPQRSHENLVVCPITGGSFQVPNFGEAVGQGITRDDGLTTVGQFIIPSIEYKFFESKLWNISIEVNGRQWLELVDVLKSKYGAPTENKSSKKQNTFGATWDSPCFVWISKTQKIWASSPGVPPGYEIVHALPDSMIEFTDSVIGDKLDPPVKPVAF
jgi:hypothetical protein